MKSMSAIFDKFSALTKRLKRECPDETEGFLNLMPQTKSGTALNAKQKHLIPYIATSYICDRAYSIVC